MRPTESALEEVRLAVWEKGEISALMSSLGRMADQRKVAGAAMNVLRDGLTSCAPKGGPRGCGS
jgi:hypothetical protein